MNGVAGRSTRFFLTWLFLAVLVAVGAWLSEQRAVAIAGAARVIDGDSLWVADTEVRLFGIDAPELLQKCQRAGRHVPCGREAVEALRRMIAGREVSCRERDRDRYGRMVAVCHASGVDLGAAMVKEGLATAYGSYEADEREARDARRGLWALDFERPAAWRERHPRKPQ